MSEFWEFARAVVIVTLTLWFSDGARAWTVRRIDHLIRYSEDERGADD